MNTASIRLSLALATSVLAISAATPADAQQTSDTPPSPVQKPAGQQTSTQTPTQAQTTANTAPNPPAGSAPTSASNQELADIVVTAQRRSENLQNVPIAVTALTPQNLAQANASGTLDLVRAVPALSFNTALGGFGQPRIRGVGTTATGPGIENPVATYVDGVYIGSSTGTLFSLNDVAQVAVLKGPQGTLFGRNATGGLIQVTTKQPTHDFTADFTGTVGSYDTIGGTAFVSGGITSGLTGDVALLYENQHDGFGKNLYNGDDVQAHRTFGSRAKLRFEPASGTSFTLSGDYSTLTASDPAIRTTGTTIFGGTTPGGPYDIDLDTQPYLHTRNYGVSLNAQHDFGSVQLTSITAYRDARLHTILDADQTPANLIALDITQTDKQFSQEFQLLSKAAGPLKWVAGLYYFWTDGEYNPQITTGEFLSGGTAVLQTKQTLKSYAAYAQATYDFGAGTDLTVGARYTVDDRHIDATSTFIAPGGFSAVTANYVDSKSFKKPTWRLALDHRFAPGVLGYISYNRGFKSGTYTPQFDENNQIDLLKPEVLDAYEAGLKTEFFDHRVRLNTAAFYYHYDNIQVNQIKDGTLFVYDGKGAREYGLDADLEARVTSQFRVTGGVSLLHARYTGFDSAYITTPLTPVFPAPCCGAPNGGNTVVLGPLGKTRLQNTPDYTFNFGGSYDIPTSFGRFTAAANYYLNGGYYTAPENRLKQPRYNIVDASLTWVSPDDRLSIELWGKNLTNAFYVLQYDALNFGDNRVAAPPRTFGVTGGLHF